MPNFSFQGGLEVPQIYFPAWVLIRSVITPLKGLFIYYVIKVEGRGVSQSLTHYDTEGDGGIPNYDV